MKSTGRKMHKLIARTLTIVISAALMITALPVTGSFGGPAEPFAVNAASQDGVYRKLISLQQKLPVTSKTNTEQKTTCTSGWQLFG